MENPAVKDLIRRASICGMSVVFDEGVFLETLKRVAPQADLRAAEITYVSLRIPNFCRVGYRVDVGGAPLELDVRAGRREDVAEWRAAEFRDPIPGPLGRGRVLLEESAILINVFPNDAKLREVQHLTDEEERSQVMRDLFPHRSEFWEGEFRPLRYRAERRFVGELRGAEGGHAVVKACTHRAYMRSKRNAMAFQPDGPLNIARLIGASDNRRLLAYEWLPGRSLYDIYIEAGASAEPMRVAGEALATMHAQQPEGLSYWTRESQSAHLRAVAEEIGFVCPPLADRAQAVALRFEEKLPETPPDPVAIHGDISARHLLVDDHKTGIIDLDWACYGDAADDLGYLVAHVERAAVTGKTLPERVDQFREAMVEGYGRSDDTELRKRIDLYTGIGLFQQARFPFRSWRPNWPQSTETLLARTETYANGLD
jgi:tRNA A-37 threonylcarbamoyl transferase component Bud32